MYSLARMPAELNLTMNHDMGKFGDFSVLTRKTFSMSLYRTVPSSLELRTEIILDRYGYLDSGMLAIDESVLIFIVEHIITDLVTSFSGSWIFWLAC